MDYRTAPGFTMTLAEREFLREGASGCKRIVSIEMGPGVSLWCFRASAPKAILYGISMDPPPSVLSTLKGDSEIVFLEASSEEEARSFNGDIDLLFVDGSHSFKDVLCDLASWSGLVSPGGLVILHDYRLNSMPEIEEAVDFWLKHITRKIWQPVEAPDSLFALRCVPRKRRPNKEGNPASE